MRQPATAIPKLARENKCDQVRDRLRQWIRTQNLQPGQKIRSQNELARLFQVTPPTVCKALTELTREGVLYRVQGKGTFLGSAPGGRQARRLCLILPRPGLDKPSANPDNWHIIQRVIQAFTEQVSRIGTLGITIVPSDRPATEALAELLEYDAVVLISWHYPELISQLTAKGKPVGIIFSRMKSALMSWCSNVWYGREASTRRGLGYLVQCGYRRIAFAGNRSSEKFTGYQKALKDFDLPYDERRVISDIIHQRDGLRAASILLERRESFDAVFADTDLKALEIIRFFQQQGLRVPEDVGVMGHDGVEELIPAAPYLTTIRIPFREMAATLIKMFQAPEPTADRRIEVPGQLVEGVTTRRPVKTLSFQSRSTASRSTGSSESTWIRIGFSGSTSETFDGSTDSVHQNKK